jgi:hypothetical protein
MLYVLKGLAAAVTLWLLLGAGAREAQAYAAMDARAAAGAQAVKRLILTDGSYQTVTEWEKIGDRVKYFSAERGEWEELPVTLVDWKATEAWNAERAKSQAEELKQVTEEEIAARKEAQLNTPLVAEQLRLPAEGGVFLLEEVAGKPVLSKLEASKVQVDDEAGKNVLRRTVNPVSGVEQKIELTGKAAKVRVRSVSPSIFVDVDNGEEAIAGDLFRMVRLERKKDMRVLARNKVPNRGDPGVKESFVHTRAEKFSGDWWKMIVLEDLTPGEYAIVSTAAGQDGMVWDFGVEK